jgi:hypothetical protein
MLSVHMLTDTAIKDFYNEFKRFKTTFQKLIPCSMGLEIHPKLQTPLA